MKEALVPTCSWSFNEWFPNALISGTIPTQSLSRRQPTEARIGPRFRLLSCFNSIVISRKCLSVLSESAGLARRRCNPREGSDFGLRGEGHVASKHYFTRCSRGPRHLVHWIRIDRCDGLSKRPSRRERYRPSWGCLPRSWVARRSLARSRMASRMAS